MNSQPEIPIIKSLVKKILEHPFDYDWSLQGLGMLRLYIDSERRLHVWDDRYAVENVSQMHTHPWNFRSIVVAGCVRNLKFVESEAGEIYNRQKIFCGVGGGLVGEADTVRLFMVEPEIRTERQSYVEDAHEIHVSSPLRGTVTIIRREYLDDADHAYVYWKEGNWVSAEPRPATKEEIEDITQTSLMTWF